MASEAARLKRPYGYDRCECGGWKRKGSQRCRLCGVLHRSGSNNSNWRGGRKTTGGYVRLFMPEHEFADSRGYIKRANWNYEQATGHVVTLPECIGHRNGIKDDDRPENLELFANNVEHRRLQHGPDLEKMAEARRLRVEGLLYREIGERLGVSYTTARMWCLPLREAERVARAKRIAEAKRLKAAGLGPIEIGKKVGVSVSTVRRWTREEGRLPGAHRRAKDERWLTYHDTLTGSQP